MTQAELEQGVGEILIDEETLQARIGELGVEISADYAGRDLLLVGVLKGAVFFMADLMRELTVPCEIDFMAISSYGAATDSSGVVRILKDLDINVAGRDVLVVEDIIDSGLTLSYLMRNLRARKPASLEVVDAPHEARAPRDRRAGALRRLRDPEPVRDRVRARLRGALPKPAVRRGPARGSGAERHIGRATPPVTGDRGSRAWVPKKQVLPSDNCRESLLPKRTLPADHHRAARLSGESDAVARQERAAEDDLLGGDRRGQERATSTRSCSRRSRQQISATLVDGDKVKVNYPTPQSATEFQNLLAAAERQVRLEGHGLVGVVGDPHQLPARSSS